MVSAKAWPGCAAAHQTAYRAQVGGLVPLFWPPESAARQQYQCLPPRNPGVPGGAARVAFSFWARLCNKLGVRQVSTRLTAPDGLPVEGCCRLIFGWVLSPPCLLCYDSKSSNGGYYDHLVCSSHHHLPPSQREQVTMRPQHHRGAPAARASPPARTSLVATLHASRINAMIN